MNQWSTDCLIQGAATFMCVPTLVSNVLGALFMFAGTVAVFIIIAAGFRFILAGGDSKQLDGARKAIVYAVAGLLIILLSSLILNIIVSVTGVTCISVWPFNFTNCVGK